MSGLKTCIWERSVYRWYLKVGYQVGQSGGEYVDKSREEVQWWAQEQKKGTRWRRGANIREVKKQGVFSLYVKSLQSVEFLSSKTFFSFFSHCGASLYCYLWNFYHLLVKQQFLIRNSKITMMWFVSARLKAQLVFPLR